MKTKAPKRTFIAFCTKLAPVRGTGDNFNIPQRDIEIQIGLTDDRHGNPINYSYEWDQEKFVPGGCSARIFAIKDYDRSQVPEGDKFKSCLLMHGPAITRTFKTAEYEAALSTVKTINKRMKGYYQARGHAVDAADELGRFLEACGVSVVYFRPPDNTETWLNRGEWRSCHLGAFVLKVREQLPENAKVESTETAVATL